MQITVTGYRLVLCAYFSDRLCIHRLVLSANYSDRLQIGALCIF